jgi:hypothetical protein
VHQDNDDDNNNNNDNNDPFYCVTNQHIMVTQLSGRNRSCVGSINGGGGGLKFCSLLPEEIGLLGIEYGTKC